MRKLLLFLLIFLLFRPGQAFAAETEVTDFISLASEAAILVDSDSGAVLYEKNSTQRMYPASLTKIATAIYAIEKGNLDEAVTVSWNAVIEEGSSVYLREGEVMPLITLIQGMFVNSGNDASTAIAEHLHGSVEKFSEKLNKYLKEEIGVQNTHFVNAHGLFAEDHYTTAADLAAITNYALKNPVFREIFGTKRLPWDGQAWTTTLITHHLLLKGEIPCEWTITGGKTGFVNQSRHTLATTAESDDIRLTAIVLKANVKNQMYDDTKKLLDYGFKNYRTNVIPKNKEFRDGEQVFTPGNDLYVTEDIRGFSMELVKNGKLEIKNSQDKTIQTAQLKPVEKKDPSLEGNDQLGILSMNTVFLLLAVALVTVYLTVKRKVRRSRF